MRNEQLFTRGGYEVSAKSDFLNLNVFNFIHSKISQSDRLLRSCSQKFTAHYACSNENLNLRLVEAVKTELLIFQKIDSFMESSGGGGGGGRR